MTYDSIIENQLNYLKDYNSKSTYNLQGISSQYLSSPENELNKKIEDLTETIQGLKDTIESYQRSTEEDKEASTQATHEAARQLEAIMLQRQQQLEQEDLRRRAIELQRQQAMMPNMMPTMIRGYFDEDEEVKSDGSHTSIEEDIANDIANLFNDIDDSDETYATATDVTVTRIKETEENIIIPEIPSENEESLKNPKEKNLKPIIDCEEAELEKDLLASM